MKTQTVGILCLSYLLFSCSDNQTKLPETKDQQNQSDKIEYLESSSSHSSKTFDAQWSVTRKTLRGGKQEGVELLTLDNGNLQISIIPDRGMGIFDVRSAGVRLGWDSPVKEIVHPSHINLDSRSGLGWLEGFNEWMVRCGLEFAGHPGTDEFINNTGSPATLNLTLHGKIQNIPASSYEVAVDPSPPHRIRIRGTVYEKFFYGPKLKLITEISTIPGSDTFQISDQLTNEGAFAQEFQLIYHGNYGSSILEEGATVFTPARSVTPMNDHAAKGIDNWKTYKAPTPALLKKFICSNPSPTEKVIPLPSLLMQTVPSPLLFVGISPNFPTSQFGKIPLPKKMVMSPGSNLPPVFPSIEELKENMGEFLQSNQEKLDHSLSTLVSIATKTQYNLSCRK